MTLDTDSASRRTFLSNVGRLASAAALAGCASPSISTHATPSPTGAGPIPGSNGWDLRWIELLRPATDRAVFDWQTLGDPADPTVLETAERYLDNCRSAYAAGSYDALAVLNIRGQAIGAAMTDVLWQRYSLGIEFNAKDPATQQPAVRNPFWYRAPNLAPGIATPSMADLIDRGVVVLVCDFAMGNLSKRIATKLGRPADDVHADIRANLVHNAFAVPSGIFGLARAQNAGCAYVRT